jgi:exopolyphosphatase/guanosine-5'-triphosphate,3'-diphosphate pyrophosphatase
MEALVIFEEKIKEFSVTNIQATGTSAIRNARNGQEFLLEIKERFGFNIKKIEGNLEAELIYKGVAYSFPFPQEPIWVMDIGGGSVEFILGKGEEIIWKKSFEIGAARLIDAFAISEPITHVQLQNLDDFFETNLQEVWQKQAIYQAKIFAGSAGSFDTLREVLEKDLNERLEEITAHAHLVSLAQVEKFTDFILSSTVEERQEMKGLPNFRVDMIVAASTLMSYVLKRLGSTQIIASHYALKEGILANIKGS